MRTFEVIQQSFHSDGKVPVEDRVACVEFINNGNNIVVINESVQILPFNSWIPALPVADEYDIGSYRFRFVEPSTNKNLIVSKKYYNNVPNRG